VRLLRIKNWTEFQHYKDRNPPWIKLHRALLDDYEFSRLHDASKAHLLLIWLFASQLDGAIPEDAQFLKRKLGLDKEPDLNLLINHGFLIPEQVASTALAQDASNPLLESYKATYTSTEKKQKGVATLPDWIPVEAWNGWLEVRQRNKAPNTARALNLAMRDLERLKGQGHDPVAILENATVRGWRGLFPPSKVNGAEPDYSAVQKQIEEEERQRAKH
jgi:hypothetical protein